MVVERLGLPQGTEAGFSSGTSLAMLCALAESRDDDLRRQDWDVKTRGLFGTPRARGVLG